MPDYALTVNEPVEVEEIVRLARSVGRPWVDPERVPRMLASADCYLARRDDGRLVGLATLVSDGAFMAYAQHVWVSPDCHGLGIGRAMMERMIRDCENKGYLGLGLFADPEAVDFYGRFGFEPVKNKGYQALIRDLARPTGGQDHE
ncbi:MAG: GNAT family N-acetyltransferase [Proteobacteria bacterium]|nr:GNAT family N-acetyltransferase [Pseudomonadota bacterium]